MSMKTTEDGAETLKSLFGFVEYKYLVEKETPSDVKLHLAAVNGDLSVIRRLLDSGKVHVDCSDRDGTTPLILSAANGHYECVVELLEQGADPTARRHTGTTALFFAAQSGYVEIASVLLRHGTPVDIPSVDGGTPLFVACQYAHLDMIQLLIKNGANVNAQMKVMKPGRLSHVGRVNEDLLLIEPPHEPGVEGDCDGLIAWKTMTVMLEESLQSTIGWHLHRVETTRQRDGATPVFIAAQNGHCSVVSLLLGHSARVSIPRLDSATPLWIAAQMNHSDVCRQLLQAGHPVDILRKNGATALFKACHKGHIDVVHELLKCKPNLALLPNGESALHAACLFGHLPVVKMLMKAGADPKLPNQDGFIPLDLAKNGNHPQVVHYLQQWQIYMVK